MNAKWIGGLMIVCGCLAAAAGTPLSGQDHRDSDKPAKHHKDLAWSPPDVSAPVRPISLSPPCDLSSVLKEVGTHAQELTANLENFTAEEKIEYEMLDQNGFQTDNDSAVFDYVFAFDQRGGGRVSHEYRTPANGGHSFPASGQDTGQVALGLIFHSSMQADYDMNCAGLGEWNGEPAWVIQFQQRKDKPKRTLQFRNQEGSFSAMLKGRAWISRRNAQVLRLETALMQGIPQLRIRSSVVVVDYAPVEIRSLKLELWLPQRVEAYWEISDRRTILYHTFSSFKLFSVDTEQSIKKP
jgi:hypothetical protein